ncbi:hypothetical protein B296_00035525, partial [Ensete ventricosum]
HDKSYEHSFMKKRDAHKLCAKSILAIPNVLAHEKSYEHDFTKKRDDHKLYTKCLARKVSFRSVFRALSQNFKILAITNVLAHGMSYEHGFAKKCDEHKHCTKSHFDQFFVHRLRIS